MLSRPTLDFTFFSKLFGNPGQNAWLVSPDIYADETELVANCRNNFSLLNLKHLYLHALPSNIYLEVIHRYLKVHPTEILVLDHMGHNCVKRVAELLHKKRLSVLAINNLEDDSVKFIVETLIKIASTGRAIVLKCGLNISPHLMVDINDYNATLALGYQAIIPTESSTVAIHRQFAPSSNALISSDPTAPRQIRLHSAEHDAAIAKAKEILTSARPSTFRLSESKLTDAETPSRSHTLSPFILR